VLRLAFAASKLEPAESNTDSQFEGMVRRKPAWLTRTTAGFQDKRAR
jgi:hypothetical protein